MNRRRLLARLAAGHLNNVRFADMADLIAGFGFDLARVSGSHHIFTRAGLNEQINLQDLQGEAKPYQIRQFLRLVERYNLRLKERR